MSLYFFHVKDGQDYIDGTGTECATLVDVRSEELHAAGTMLRELGPEFWRSPVWSMRVTDLSGEMVLKLNFSVDGFAPPWRLNSY